MTPEDAANYGVENGQIVGVKVESVNTVSRKGKLKRMGRSEGYTAATKKAVVQLKADSKAIEFFASLS